MVKYFNSIMIYYWVIKDWEQITNKSEFILFIY